MIVSIIDSYASYVRTRLLAANAQVALGDGMVAQPFGGVVSALSWPSYPAKEGALYLLVQKLQPVGRSKGQVQYNIYCQWAWLVIGTNTGPMQLGNNRGDRYATDMQIMQNLKEANFPGFCQKIDYSVSNAGVMSGVPATSQFPVAATERIRWNELEFMPQTNRNGGDSGVLYNAAATTVMGWEDMQAVGTLDYADTQGPQIA